MRKIVVSIIIIGLMVFLWQSLHFEKSKQVGKGMKFTMLGVATMKEKGNMNSMGYVIQSHKRKINFSRWWTK